MRRPKKQASLWRDLAWTSLLAIVYTTYAQWPALTKSFYINNDAVQHLIWLYDTNWGNSFYADAAGVIQPWGYGLLCRFFTLFITPVQLALYGPYLIAISTVFLGFRALRPYLPTALALGAAMFALHLSFGQVTGFFGRAFAVPVLLLFAVFWLRRNYVGVVISWIIGALFYPPSLLLNMGVVGLEFPLLLFKEWKNNGSQSSKVVSVNRDLSEHQLLGKIPLFRNTLVISGWKLLLIGGILTLGILLAKSYEIKHHENLGDFVDQELLLTAPEFQEGGRVDFKTFHKKPFFNYLQPRVNSWLQWRYMPWSYLALAALFVVAVVVQRKQRVNRLDTYLIASFLAAMILYYLAQLLLPQLFLPDRFVNRTGRWFLAVIAVRAFYLFPFRWRNELAAGVTLAIIILVISPQLVINSGLASNSGYRVVYETAADLPEDALIAGPLYAMNQVPFFAKRSVLISEESAHALYFQHYYDHVTPRWHDYTMAWSASMNEPDLLKNLIEKYGVTHLFIDRISLAEKSFGTFNPYRKLYSDRTSKLDPDQMLLLNIPEDSQTILSGRYAIVTAENLLHWLETLPRVKTIDSSPD